MTDRKEARHTPVADNRADVHDATAARAYDAVEFGDVPPEAVVKALEDTLDEVREEYDL